jgi:hypothetical protein
MKRGIDTIEREEYGEIVKEHPVCCEDEPFPAFSN